MKNLRSLLLVASFAATAASALASGPAPTEKLVVAMCQNKFVGEQTFIYGHFEKNGKLRNLESSDLELVRPSVPMSVDENGTIDGPRYSSYLSSGAVVEAALAGRNIYFYFAGNGGLVLEEAWGGTTPTAIEFNTNDELVKSFSIRITYQSQRNAAIVEEVAVIEDCVFHGAQKLIKAAQLFDK